MKLFKKSSKLLLVFIILVIMILPSISLAEEASIILGNADDFAILAGQTITNTGKTTINGNVGISPGSSLTQGAAIINGTVHLNDAIIIQAKEDLTTAYNIAAGRLPINTIPSELGGSTLKPGYYVSASGTFELTGTLTLDAEGNSEAVFVFMTDSSLITATSSQVKVINGADHSQIFWKVGSSATLGITSHFEGTIMAMESITLTTGATINGSLLARNGSVTLDSNTINKAVVPIISVAKTADKSILSEGPETVTYSYLISNLGSSNLDNIIVIDDKISDVTYVSGDTNEDKILQPSEVWTYNGSMMLDETITNTVTVSGNSNSAIVTDTDVFTVTVVDVESTQKSNEDKKTTELETTSNPDPESDDTTVQEPNNTTPIGGELPDTATPLYLYLISGLGFMLLGLVGLKINKKI